MMDKKQVVKLILFPVILLTILWILLFVPAGTVHYMNGWYVWGSFAVITAMIGVYFAFINPAFLEKRSTVKNNQTKISISAFLKLYYTGFLLPGLDFRFHWSNMSKVVSEIGIFIFIFGYLFIFYVFQSNSFASANIQVDGDQHTITTGPYILVRHPMYTGMILISLSMPIALGSYYALIPMALIIPTLVYRIKGEEQLLQKELKGYVSYCEKVKYRLFPFLW